MLSTEENKPHFVYVGQYTDFSNLAHQPKGTLADSCISVFKLEKGELLFVNKLKKDNCPNAAFFRHSPQTNTIYGCTETIFEDGEVMGFDINRETGDLSLKTKQYSGGKSTCYLTFSPANDYLYTVNYWNSTVGALPLKVSGEIDPVAFVKKSQEKHVAENRDDHLRKRQSEPHFHALVCYGGLLFVPDLGKDKIRQFRHSSNGELQDCGSSPTTPGGGVRYIIFHENLPIAYAVNELACNVQVFQFEGHPKNDFDARLTCIQTISTIPENYSGPKSTCGRIAIDPTGRYVIVSNRGHDSLCWYEINMDDGEESCRSSSDDDNNDNADNANIPLRPGMLNKGRFISTHGKTPRHFQLDPSGKSIIVANQDSDNLALFSFEPENGNISFRKIVENVPSPNFVCVISA